MCTHLICGRIYVKGIENGFLREGTSGISHACFRCFYAYPLGSYLHHIWDAMFLDSQSIKIRFIYCAFFLIVFFRRRELSLTNDFLLCCF